MQLLGVDFSQIHVKTQAYVLILKQVLCDFTTQSKLCKDTQRLTNERTLHTLSCLIRDNWKCRTGKCGLKNDGLENGGSLSLNS